MTQAVGCPDDNELAQLADGTLAEPDQLRVERHLDACATCSAVVGEIAWVIAPPHAAPPGYRLERPDAHDAWLGVDTRIGKRVALRFAAVDPGAIAAALAARAVAHPALRRVADAGEHAGQRFVVEEPAVGVAADAWLAAGPRTDAEVVAVWRQAIEAVAALHAAGVVHGAIAPAHVRVGPSGAATVGGVGSAEPARTSGLVAPERLHGAPPSAAADQFALCACLWEALADAPAFSGATAGALAVKMLSPPAPPDTRQVFAVLARGLAADPARRWPDLNALVRALARPPRRRRALWWIAGAVAAAVAGAIAIAAIA